MKEREIKSSDNVMWKCVQAFAGTNGAAAAKAVDKTSTEGEVEVVCTPSGGAQTVRLRLNEGWENEMKDDELVSEIDRQRSR